jgi:hypothetical protein
MTRDIEVEAMEGMTRKQVRITNNIANALIADHAMCVDCAINVSFVWGASGAKNKPMCFHPCSQACDGALLEFMHEHGWKPTGEVIDVNQLPSRAN